MSEATSTPAVPEVPAKDWSNVNPVFVAVKAMMLDPTNKANAIAAEIKASRVDVNKSVLQLRQDEKTEDAAIREYQEFLEKASAAIEARTAKINADIAERLVAKSEMTDEVYNAKSAEHKELKKAATKPLEIAKDLAGFDPEYFADLPALLTLSGGSSGDGPKRPRISSITVDGVDVFEVVKDKDGVESHKTTFTIAAAWLTKKSGEKIKPSDLQAAAFTTAGTEDLSTVNDVSFSYSVKGTNYAFVVIPASASK